MTTSTVTPEQLATALLQTAAGYPANVAAVQLLIDHDYWIRRIAYHHPQYHRIDSEDGQVWDLEWERLAVDVGCGKLHGGTTRETDILSIALSLRDGLLNHAIVGTDASTVRAIINAIATASDKDNIL